MQEDEQVLVIIFSSNHHLVGFNRSEPPQQVSCANLHKTCTLKKNILIPLLNEIPLSAIRRSTTSPQPLFPMSVDPLLMIEGQWCKY